MDLTTLAMVGTVVSAGKIIYEVGSKVSDMFSDDDQQKAAKAAESQSAPSVLAGLSPEGVNNAVEGAPVGSTVDFSA